MKKMIAALTMSLVLGTVARAQDKAAWKEMDEFHTIIGATFHPAEEGDLQPARTRSKELVEKAVAWYNSAVPQGYDQTKTAAALKKLVKGAKELDKMVKASVTDQQLAVKLSAIHDVFHGVMEKCRKEDQH